jgi:hypothetical protein
MRCPTCGGEFNPTKDFFITVHERKSRSLNFCSLECATDYVYDR